MGVLATTSEQRCKLCRHPRRADVDALLYRRSRLEYDEAGNRINLEYVLHTLGDWGVENPTSDNVKIHWRKHCTVVEGEEAEAKTEFLQQIELMKAQGVHVDVNADLEWLWAVWILELRERVARGEKSGLPVDFGLKVSAEMTRRQHTMVQDDLLKALVGGIGEAGAQRKVMLNPAQPSEDDIEDANFEDVE